MKIVKAAASQIAQDNVIPINLSNAIIERNAPGFYQHHYATGKINYDSTLSLLFKDCQNEDDLVEIKDAIAEVFTSSLLPRRLITNMFAKPTQYIAPNVISMDVLLIEEAVAKATESAAVASKVVPFLTEMIMQGFEPLGIVHPTAGFSYFEPRQHRYPEHFTIAREFAKMELQTLLEQYALAFVAKSSSRFIPQSMITQMTENFGHIAMGMRRLGYYNQYLMDAYYVISKIASNDNLVTAGIPKSVLDSRSAAELKSNITFVSLALENAPEDIHTAEWELQKAVDTVVELLYLSKRLQIVDLATSVAHYRYTNVLDGRSNVVGGVLSPHIKSEFTSDVAIFSGIDNYTQHKTGSKLPNYTSVMAGMFEPFSNTNLFGGAHSASVQLMSHCRITESDEESLSTLVSLTELSEMDLIHIAAARADSTGYYLDEDDKLVIVFNKQLNGLRVKMPDLPFADTVATIDAATLILCCQSFEETAAFVYKKKVIEPNTWGSRFLDIDDHTTAFNTEDKFVFTIDDEALSVQTNLLSLMHLRRRSSAVLMTDENLAKWITDATVAPFMALSLSDSKLLDGSSPEVISNPAYIQTSHLMVNALKPIMNTRHFKIITRDLVRRIANKAPEAAREASYQKLHQVHLLKQVQIEVALFIIKTIGMTVPLSQIAASDSVKVLVDQFAESTGITSTNDDAAEINISDIYDVVLQRSDYYQHLIGAELVEIGHAINELD